MKESNCFGVSRIIVGLLKLKIPNSSIMKIMLEAKFDKTIINFCMWKFASVGEQNDPFYNTLEMVLQKKFSMHSLSKELLANNNFLLGFKQLESVIFISESLKNNLIGVDTAFKGTKYMLQPLLHALEMGEFGMDRIITMLGDIDGCSIEDKVRALSSVFSLNGEDVRQRLNDRSGRGYD